MSENEQDKTISDAGDESGLMQLKPDIEGDIAKEIENVPIPPAPGFTKKIISAARRIWWLWAALVMGIISYIVLKGVFLK